MLANSITNSAMDYPERELAFGTLYMIKHHSTFGAKL